MKNFNKSVIILGLLVAYPLIAAAPNKNTLKLSSIAPEPLNDITVTRDYGNFEVGLKFTIQKPVTPDDQRTVKTIGYVNYGLYGKKSFPCCTTTVARIENFNVEKTYTEQVKQKLIEHIATAENIDANNIFWSTTVQRQLKNPK